MNSDQSSASQNSPKVTNLMSVADDGLTNLMKFDTRALSIPKALEPEKSSKTMDPAVSERTTGLKPLEVMAKRKRDQQEEDEGEANLPWYTRDYDSDELGLMGDTDLDKVLDAFYDEGAKDSERKGPEDNAPAKRRRREPQSRVPDIHVTAVEEFFPRNDPSVCKSLDPRVYWKHPLGCGCNNKISHSASVETTTVSDNSTDYTSLFGAPSCYTETARSTAASDPRRRHPGSIFEQVECNRKPPSAASSSITGTTRYTAAPSPMATYDLAPEHLSPVLYSRDAPYDLQDWNEEYLELLQPNENERRALGE